MRRNGETISAERVSGYLTNVLAFAAGTAVLVLQGKREDADVWFRAFLRVVARLIERRRCLEHASVRTVSFGQIRGLDSRLRRNGNCANIGPVLQTTGISPSQANR